MVVGTYSSFTKLLIRLIKHAAEIQFVNWFNTLIKLLCVDPNLTVSIEGDVDAAKLFVVRTDPIADEGNRLYYVVSSVDGVIVWCR